MLHGLHNRYWYLKKTPFFRTFKNDTKNALFKKILLLHYSTMYHQRHINYWTFSSKIFVGADLSHFDKFYVLRCFVRIHILTHKPFTFIILSFWYLYCVLSYHNNNFNRKKHIFGTVVSIVSSCVSYSIHLFFDI